VADCAPVYLVDPVRRVVALLHSGKKGSQANITRVALAKMQREYGCRAHDIVLQLGPCIRPPAYEVDVPALILEDARAAGLRAENIHDCGLCTHADAAAYYSYRRELGVTGRMLALLGLRVLCG
jgi:hypothetical protein